MSMDVSGVSNSKFDYQGFIDKLNASGPTDTQGVDKTEKTKEKSNLVFTKTEKTMGNQQTTSTPELDAPKKTDSAGLDTCNEKVQDTSFVDSSNDEQVKAAAKKFEDALRAILPEATGGVLFDVYALMALMLQASQAQRDSARELRLAENMAIQTAIQNQADAQRTSAIAGMVAGLVVCGMQIGLQGLSLSKSIQGVRGQQKAMTESGIDAANKEVQVSQQKLETQAQKSEMTQGKLDLAEQKLDVAKNNQSAAKQEFNLAKQNVADKTAVRDAAQNKVNNAKGELSKAAAEKELAAANKDLDDATAARDSAKTKLDKADVELEQAQGERDLAAKNHDIEKANTQKAVDEYAGAEKKMGHAQNRLQGDTRQLSGRNTETKWHTLGDMVAALGNTAQQAVRGMTEIIQAEATEMGADVKREEHNLDLTRDLFNQAQDVIRAVLSLFSAVIQAETQSMRDAIHA